MNKQQELAEQILEKHSLLLSIETGGHFSKHLKIEEPKEYKAIIAAIVEAMDAPAKEVEAISDSEKYLPPDNGDICWQIGSETFTRKEVAHLLHTQRAMIGNDLKAHCGNNLTTEMFDIINNPRTPNY
jgi:hypothetical protein